MHTSQSKITKLSVADSLCPSECSIDSTTTIFPCSKGKHSLSQMCCTLDINVQEENLRKCHATSRKCEEMLKKCVDKLTKYKKRLMLQMSSFLEKCTLPDSHISNGSRTFKYSGLCQKYSCFSFFVQLQDGSISVIWAIA